MESIDVLPPEKIAFIAYNIGVYESVQKFGGLITSGKITNGTDVSKIANDQYRTTLFCPIGSSNVLKQKLYQLLFLLFELSIQLCIEVVIRKPADPYIDNSLSVYKRIISVTL
jgi:hypothetical protein